MRIAVLIVALLGAACAGFLGMTWVSDASDKKSEIAQLEKMASDFKNAAESLGGGSALDLTEVNSNLAKIRNASRAGWLLLLGAMASSVSCVLLLIRKVTGKQAAKAMILSSALPAFFAPISLVFSFSLLIAGGLAFFVKESRSQAGLAGV